MAKRAYIFSTDEIKCCYDCPFYYDYIYCLIDPLEKPRGSFEYTDYDHDERPDWCPMIEVKDVCEERKPNHDKPATTDTATTSTATAAERAAAPALAERAAAAAAAAAHFVRYDGTGAGEQA